MSDGCWTNAIGAPTTSLPPLAADSAELRGLVDGHNHVTRVPTAEFQRVCIVTGRHQTAGRSAPLQGRAQKQPMAHGYIPRIKEERMHDEQRQDGA